MRLLIPLILLAASPAAAADQFDLACKGYKWTKIGGPSQDYSFRARIDLAAEKWCEGECKAALPIFSVTPDELVLTDEGTLNSRIEMSRRATYDRKTNAFHYLFLQTRPTDDYLETQTVCTTEPFTPLP